MQRSGVRPASMVPVFAAPEGGGSVGKHTAVTADYRPEPIPGGVLNLLAAAVPLIGYAEIVRWFGTQGRTPDFVAAIDTMFAEPLQVNDGFAFLSTAFLLLVAGYLIAASLALSTREIVGRQCIVQGALITVAGASLWMSGVPLPRAAYIASLVLALVGIIALTALTSVIFGGVSWLSVAVEMTALAVLVSVLPRPSPFAAAAVLGFVILIGHLIWLIHTGDMPAWAGASLGVICWGGVVWGVEIGVARDGHSASPLTLAYAAVLMAVAVQISGRKRPVVKWASSRVWGVTLGSFCVPSLLMPRLLGYMPDEVVALITVITIVALGEALYWLAAAFVRALEFRVARGPSTLNHAR